MFVILPRPADVDTNTFPWIPSISRPQQGGGNKQAASEILSRERGVRSLSYYIHDSHSTDITLTFLPPPSGRISSTLSLPAAAVPGQMSVENLYRRESPCSEVWMAAGLERTREVAGVVVERCRRCGQRAGLDLR